MLQETNFGVGFSRPVHVSELEAVRVWPFLEELIESIEQSGAGPPTTTSTPISVAEIVAEQLVRHPECRGTFAQLWFLAMNYFQVRDQTRFWHELTPDDKGFLEWFLGEACEYDEDGRLTLREQIVLLLREHNMKTAILLPAEA